MLNNNTFGDTPAAITLVKIINEKKIYSRHVSKILTNFNQVLRELTKIDSRIALGLATNVYKHHCDKADKLSVEISSYTRNILAARYKIWVESRNGQKPYKYRNDNPNNCIHKK